MSKLDIVYQELNQRLAYLEKHHAVKEWEILKNSQLQHQGASQGSSPCQDGEEIRQGQGGEDRYCNRNEQEEEEQVNVLGTGHNGFGLAQVKQERHLCLDRTLHYYIAGPMSDCEDFNYPYFNRVARELRAQGYNCVNPAEICVSTWSREKCMHTNIRALMDCCSAILLLPGWQYARGARIEFEIAMECGYELYHWSDSCFLYA